MKFSIIASTLGLAAALVAVPAAHALDADAGQALAKKEGCLKCHAIDKKKDASSLKDIAKKYAGKADAEAKMMTQITTGPKIKLEDGSEEEHKIAKSKDKAELTNMIQWILSLK